MSDKFTPYANLRGLVVSLGFWAWGLGAAFFVLDWHRSWPLALFYLALLVNSYFSIRTFASITPTRHPGQQFLDILLAVCLAFLPVNFNSVQNFVLITTALFIVATLKYIFLLPIAGYSRLLYTKIRVDALGIMFCFGALVGTLFGYGHRTAILWTILFVAANFYVLWWKPHYSVELHYESQ